jgi:hypothetical protein
MPSSTVTQLAFGYARQCLCYSPCASGIVRLQKISITAPPGRLCGAGIFQFVQGGEFSFGVGFGSGDTVKCFVEDSGNALLFGD